MRKCILPGCDNKHGAKNYCITHYKRWRKYGDPPKTMRTTYGSGRRIDKHGYVQLRIPDHPMASNTGYVLEHMMIMSQILGRKLEPHETVNHVNGDRQDNRKENLEMWWIKSLPIPGQNVNDLVAYAKEIIHLYG